MFWEGMERGQKLPQRNSVPIPWLFVVAVRALTDLRTVLSFTSKLGILFRFYGKNLLIMNSYLGVTDCLREYISTKHGTNLQN